MWGARKSFVGGERVFVEQAAKQVVSLESRRAPHTAAELHIVSLADALLLCLLIRDREPVRFARVALRWRARFCAGVEGSRVAPVGLTRDRYRCESAVGSDDRVIRRAVEPKARTVSDLIAAYRCVFR